VRTHERTAKTAAGRAESLKLTNPVCNLMQFKKSRTLRQTDTQTHRAYKDVQVPPSKLTLNVSRFRRHVVNIDAAGRCGRLNARPRRRRGERAEWPKLTNPVCNLIQFKKSRTHRQTDRQTDTQTHIAYKDAQVPSSRLTPNVGNDKYSIHWSVFYVPAATPQVGRI